ncbi:unnamed protein product [Discula destructiva]
MDPFVIEAPMPVPEAFLAPLKDHLPHSFALLRRAQFTRSAQGTWPHAHFFFASAHKTSPESGSIAPTPKHFAAAYVDLSQHPETQMYLYSTLQDTDSSNNDDNDDDDPLLNISKIPSDEVEHVLDLCAALFHRVQLLAEAADPALTGRGPHGGGVMVGNFHEATYRLLVARRGLVSSYWNPHDVWLFCVDELPASARAAGGGEDDDDAVACAGLAWSVVRREDVPLIASRTKIPKVADTLMMEPSVAVRDGEGALVAWGFMGVAGTLSTLHVEEPYRGKGIAKALATKVLREHSFGDDPWGSADVHIDNVQSQRLCRSLGGKKGMRTCWAVVRIDFQP